MLVYTGDYVSDDLKPTENDDDNLNIMQWVSPLEVTKLPLSPPMQKLLAESGTWKKKFDFHSGLYVQTPPEQST